MKNLELVANLMEQYSAQLFCGNNGEPCICVFENGKQRTMLLRSEQFRSWLVRFLKRLGQKAHKSRREEITEELCANAEDGEKKNLYVRVARGKDSIQIDLNDESNDVVHISGARNGIKVAPPRDVYLLRPNKQLALPKPITGNRKLFLKKFKKLIPDLLYGHWLLVLAFILKSLNRDQGSFVILLIGGPQGSGKTILSNRIKWLIDPSMLPSLSPPRKVDDIIVASHSYLLVFDNISWLTDDMADVFCRLATGGGVAKRKNYTDHDEAFYALFRPVIINGIDEPSNRPDFLDRCVVLELKPIQNDKRIAETELESEFKESLPLLLGGIYELLADCLRVLPEIAQTEKVLPRMTDYALMGIAIERVLNLRPGRFLEVYSNNKIEQTENAFWSDDLCNAIYRKLQQVQSQRIEGSTREINDSLFGKRSRQGSSPHSTKFFSGWLKRIEPLLKTRDIVVERLPRSAEKRTIVIRSLSPIPMEKSHPAYLRVLPKSERPEDYDL